jgi:hypothetical protein
MIRHNFFNIQQLNIEQLLTSRIEKGFVRRQTAGRPDAITLVLASEEKLLIRNRTVDLQRFDVGLLDFTLVNSIPNESKEFDLPQALSEPRCANKVITFYDGAKFEVGIILQTSNALPFIVLSGGGPSTLAILGSLNREYEWWPEFEIREYQVEQWNSTQ